MEEMNDMKSYICEDCGSVRFNLLMSGKAECDDCGLIAPLTHSIACTCVNIEMGSYSSQVNVIPPNVTFIKRNIVGVDRCIIDLITRLWAYGVITIESCCGHNKTNGYIAVMQKDIPFMISQGFRQKDGRADIFVI